MQTFALIPLRGGSKSIPRKNLKLIGGKPLFQWSLEAAVGCPEIDRVFVATDDSEIRSAVESLNLSKVEVVDRSPQSATDTASTESVMLEFAEKRTFDRLVLIQATSPLLTAVDLSRGFADLKEQGANSVLSVVPQKRFIWERTTDGLGYAKNYQPEARPRRQDFAPYYIENGAFYICEREDLLRTSCRLSGKIALSEMPEESFYEIDEPSDWEIVEALLRRREAASNTVAPKVRLSLTELRERAKKIKLVISDVDGVLTDSGMYYAENGVEMKKFNTRDGKAFELLRNAGIKTGIITSEKTAIVEWRARKMKLDYLEQGAVDKLPALERVMADAGVTIDQVAFIGDDLGDVSVLERVGLAACPRDAVSQAIYYASYHCECYGGEGCLRELVEVVFEL